MNLREQILSANDFTLSPISIPEWGEEGLFFIKPMKLKTQRDILSMINNKKDALEISVVSVINSLCDSDGNFIFQKNDANALMEKSACVCGAIMREINRVNKFDDGEVENATKN